MRTNIEVSLIEGYKAIAQNSCYCMGQYYIEDDWTIEVYGENIENIINEFIIKAGNSDININSFSVEKCKWIEYNGNHYEQGENIGLESTADIYDKIFNSEKYHLLQKQLEDKKLKDKEIAENKRLKEKEQNELKEYERLQKKFKK